MKRRINKEVREEAALICSAKASDWASKRQLISIEFYSDNVQAQELARAAFLLCGLSPLHSSFVEEWAEAEAMLRTGWCPP